MADELRPVEPSWYPTFPYTRSRGFSLENVQRDMGELWADRTQLAERARQERALKAIQDSQSDMDRRRAPLRQSAAQSNPDRAIAELVAEVQAMENPGYQPGPAYVDPFHIAKTPERSLQDAKRAKYLSGMLDRFGYPTDLHQYPESWSAIQGPAAESVKSAMQRYATDAEGFRSDNQSPVEYAGVIGYGSPLRNAMTWAQGMPGMYYAAAEMGAKAADPVGAPEKDPSGRFMHALNTFTAPGQAIAGAVGYAPETAGDHSAWSAQEAVRREFDKQIDWGNMQPEMARALRDEVVNRADRQMLGKEYFTNRGASPTVAAIAGGLTDDLLNPLVDIPGIAAAAKAKGAGRLLRTGYQIGQEIAPGLTLNGLGALAGIANGQP